ncbi:GMC family oxidoreductase N-terminal domain-containing protein, partial [Mycobacterium colombiense]|uniref:GMC family oxidoreductase N-terminal domain-containing protein n=1 Tax=Mycobacterium colombiense TaxID=339268 RepID=UPI000A71AA06
HQQACRLNRTGAQHDSVGGQGHAAARTDRIAIPGWGWAEVLDSFRAIETDLDFDGPAHGDSGPIQVRRTHEMTGTTERFIAAAERAGFGWIADLNDAAPDQLSGIGAVPLNIVDGVRRGSGAGYLIPALGRPNLNLHARTRVATLRFAGTAVVGVDAVGPRGRMTLTADRVVLCAGAIET